NVTDACNSSVRKSNGKKKIWALFSQRGRLLFRAVINQEQINGPCNAGQRDDCPTASSMGFGATTTTTRSLGVSGVEADDDDDEVELVSETQKTKKDPSRSPESVCIYIFHPNIVFVHLIFSLLAARNLRKINVERLPPFKPWKSISILMMKAKGQICSQILERQRKIVSLESDSSTLAQTLELIQQEKTSLSSKLLEMRIYFTKVGEEINAKLQEQQVKDRIGEQTGETEGMESSIDEDLFMDNLGSEAKNNLMAKLDAAKAKLDEISSMKSKLVMENGKMKQLLEQVKFKVNDFEPELRTMDIKTSEEEHNALLLDKAGVIEYLQTVPSQIETLKLGPKMKGFYFDLMDKDRTHLADSVCLYFLCMGAHLFLFSEQI
ncbi:hypothetical protein CFP56_039406, partial [Quercus suber]